MQDKKIFDRIIAYGLYKRRAYIEEYMRVGESYKRIERRLFVLFLPADFVGPCLVLKSIVLIQMRIMDV